MYPHWIGIVINIAATLALSLILIKKKLFPRPIGIFMVLFIVGQIIGYGMNVDFLKVHMPYKNSGTSTSIASIAIPLALGFIIDYIGKFKRI